MNHKLKMKLRELYHDVEFFAKIYKKAAAMKTKAKVKMSDEDFLKEKFKENTGKELNLENPQTYNEKLQWLKLHDRNPQYSEMVDKFAAKQYVANIIGEEYVIPVVGGPWQSADEIDLDSLPKQFVLKCNHDCGSIVICKDKDDFNFEEAKKKLNAAVKSNYYWVGREWPYKNVKPCIFAEAYMEDPRDRRLRDYKFFCFHGQPKAVYIFSRHHDGAINMSCDYFDMDFKHIPVTDGYPNAINPPEKPLNFELMKELAAKLSENIPHVRVDFYEIENKVYFGELTFYKGGGMSKFEPEEFDYTMGSWLDLSCVK